MRGTAASPKIFLSYRREDASGSAGRLYDHLARHFPRSNLFMDVDTIAPGVDFTRALHEAVEGCDVLLAVIGKDWLSARTGEGERRLDSPEDFVRVEIATALKADVRVVPVLVDGATMPPAADLPEVLAPMALRHAVELSHSRFAFDADRLVRALGAPGAPAEPREAGLEGSLPEPAVSRITAPDSTEVGATRLVSRGRLLGLSSTVLAIFASGLVASSFAAPGGTYWLTRTPPAATLLVIANAVLGPAVAMRLWLPGFTFSRTCGVVGAIFAAFVAMVATGYVLTNLALPDLFNTESGFAKQIVILGAREVPEGLVAGVALGFFMFRALADWFPRHGGAGSARRMILIWTGAGTGYAILSFLLLSTAEAAVAATAGPDAALLAREQARVWSDTLVYGGAWAVGVFATFRSPGGPAGT